MKHFFRFTLFAALLGSTATFGQFQQSVQGPAQAKLDDALARLAAFRAEVAETKIPLAQELNQLESQVIELRREADRKARVRDSADVRLDALQQEVNGLREQVDYLRNLLVDYISGLERLLHVSEHGAYLDRIAAILNSADDADLTEAEQIANLYSGLELGIERLQEVSGGSIFEGRAILPDGNLGNGTFVLMGPQAFFVASDQGGLIQRSESETPQVIAVDVVADAARAFVDAGGSGELIFDTTQGKALAIAATQESWVEHVAKGGFWVIVIIAFGTAALIVGVFKGVELLGQGSMSRMKVREIMSLTSEGKVEEALSKARAAKGPEADMLAEGLKNRHESPELLEEILFEKVLETQPRVERLLPMIAVIAATAPLLGLLGTVTGMIKTFDLITLFGTGDARSLSGGISEALVTTEFGLIVAIPSLILHAVLWRYSRQILSRMEKSAVALLNALRRTPVQEKAAA
ncbi:MAG: MotA/TolQ/ExbB proton channel family protein [Opitutales bacterium]